VLALVALFSAPRALVAPVSQMVMATENQGFLLRWGFIMAAVNILLDVWWIPGGGALGAAFANGVSQTLAVVGIWAFAVYRLDFHPPTRSLIKMTISGVCMAVAAAAVAAVLPSLAAAILGVLVGAIAYLGLLRWTRSLDSKDQRVILSLRRQLPPWLHGGYTRIVQMVVP